MYLLRARVCKAARVRGGCFKFSHHSRVFCAGQCSPQLTLPYLASLCMLLLGLLVRMHCGAAVALRAQKEPSCPSSPSRRGRARVWHLRGRSFVRRIQAAQRSYLTDLPFNIAAVMANHSGDTSMGPANMVRGAPAAQQQLWAAEPFLTERSLG